MNVYYHISTAYRHIEQLGFSIPSLRQIRLDPHGYYGQDNSHFSPSGNWISWGEGGVDDAEDADVIWHEYGHAIQFNLVPTWGGGESGALGEGFGDYWAASYSRSLGQWDESSYHHNWVFNWDGHNPFWSGRILNDPRTYPFASLPIHSAGQIWSAALMGIWGELGREVTDKLVLKSFMYLGSGATAPDNAHALIQADRDLYNGAHVQTLLYWLGTVKRFISPDAYIPHITHVPITNSTNVFGPFEVQISVTSQHGVGNNGVTLFWGVNGNFTESATMQRISATEFSSNIPGIGLPARYQYYIRVVDSLGNAVKSPQAAPISFHQFQAGIDSVAPTILHTPLSVCTQHSWPLNVSAEVVDDFGVDSVWVEYSLGANTVLRSFRLLPTDQGNYAGIFTLSSSEVNPGDSIYYRVLAADMSIAANTSISPDGGYHIIHIESTSDVDELAGVPHEYALGQNYPNPFNPSTTIRFTLPENSAVVLTVYDIAGREIATLVREPRNAGAHTVQWDGRNARGENASSGVYFYKFDAFNNQNTVIVTETRKMLLVR